MAQAKKRTRKRRPQNLECQLDGRWSFDFYVSGVQGGYPGFDREAVRVQVFADNENGARKILRTWLDLIGADHIWIERE